LTVIFPTYSAAFSEYFLKQSLSSTIQIEGFDLKCNTQHIPGDALRRDHELSRVNLPTLLLDDIPYLYKLYIMNELETI